jgi:hypothetical protein
MILLKYSERLYQELMDELAETAFREKSLITRLETSIGICIKYLRWLKGFVQDNQPENREQEIILFKQIKPKFKAQMVFHQQLLNIESRKVIGNAEGISAYYIHELEVLTHFFKSNLSFYQYVRTDSTHLDDKYYIRGVYDLKLDPDEGLVDADESFNTSHDNKLAHVLSAELLLTYLERAIERVNNREDGDIEDILDTGDFIWTQTKSALVEIAYSWILTRAFNHGKATLNGLVRYLEKVFHVELKNFYDTFKTIRQRDQRTLYIDQMKDALLEKMNDMLK